MKINQIKAAIEAAGQKTKFLFRHQSRAPKSLREFVKQFAHTRNRELTLNEEYALAYCLFENEDYEFKNNPTVKLLQRQIWDKSEGSVAFTTYTAIKKLKSYGLMLPTYVDLIKQEENPIYWTNLIIDLRQHDIFMDADMIDFIRVYGNKQEAAIEIIKTLQRNAIFSSKMLSLIKLLNITHQVIIEKYIPLFVLLQKSDVLTIILEKPSLYAKDLDKTLEFANTYPNKSVAAMEVVKALQEGHIYSSNLLAFISTLTTDHRTIVDVYLPIFIRLQKNAILTDVITFLSKEKQQNTLVKYLSVIDELNQENILVENGKMREGILELIVNPTQLDNLVSALKLLKKENALDATAINYMRFIPKLKPMVMARKKLRNIADSADSTDDFEPLKCEVEIKNPRIQAKVSESEAAFFSPLDITIEEDVSQESVPDSNQHLAYC